LNSVRIPMHQVERAGDDPPPGGKLPRHRRLDRRLLGPSELART